eukprot:TRINITY_DN52635_c0_g2_i5.p2 TRINITY_DN52635_c0_g2~~TRINITY_DN52635_c0_g2_i5.p2  ORF type:complete len:159 (-),score=47.67 TRINITY_DN52635_c0_g2_i5:618-1094(-)
MTHNDAAHRAFVDHCVPDGKEDANAADDPLVLVVPAPLNAGVTPQLAQVVNVLMEASAIVAAYQNLLAPNFAPLQPLPFVGAPLFLPGVGIPYHHTTLTAHKVLERIADPGAVCPTIDQQGSGTILCQVNYNYAEDWEQMSKLWNKEEAIVWDRNDAQ